MGAEEVDRTRTDLRWWCSRGSSWGVLQIDKGGIRNGVNFERVTALGFDIEVFITEGPKVRVLVLGDRGVHRMISLLTKESIDAWEGKNIRTMGVSKFGKREMEMIKIKSFQKLIRPVRLGSVGWAREATMK